MNHVYFVLVCLLWGSNFILMNRAGFALGPVEIAFCRLLGGGLVLALWWRLSGQRGIPRRYWPHLALVALLGNAIPFILQPLLIARGFGHSYFGMTVAFVPLLTLLFSIPMLGIWPRWREVVGVLGGLVALVVLLRDGHSRGMSVDTLLLAVVVPLVYAFCNTYIRRFLEGVPPVPLTTAMLIFGAMFLVPLLMMPGLLESVGLGGPAGSSRWPTALASIAWMAFVGTGVSIALFMSMLKSRGPLFAGMVSYPVPLIALAWGAYDEEPITVRQLLAIVVVLSMVALVQWGRVKETGETEEPAKQSEQPETITDENEVNEQQLVRTQ